MSHFKIPIIIEHGVNPAFVKACRFLTTENFENLKIVDFQQRKEMLKNLWKNTYDSEIDWTHIFFKDSQSAMLFMLKWGGQSILVDSAE
jgi:hypothetical protein